MSQDNISVVGATPRVIDALRRMAGTPRNLIPPEQKKTVASPIQTIDTAYKGPFSIVKDTDDSGNDILMLYGYNYTKGRLFHNYIDIGTNAPIEVAEQEVIPMSTAWIFLKITYDTTYAVEVKTASEFPAQTNAELYIRIAYVEFKEGKIDIITQYQYGSISLPARIL